MVTRSPAPRPARRRRLDVPVFTQRAAECGNTSLKAVCWYHGRRLSARRLGRLAGLTDEGIEHDGMVRAAEAAGARAIARAGATTAELGRWLDRGHPPIVGWWLRDPGDAHFDPRWPLRERKRRDCGHFSVVIGLDAGSIWLMDPTPHGPAGRAGPRRLPLAEFTRCWYDTDGPGYDLVPRWFLVADFGADPVSAPGARRGGPRRGGGPRPAR
jgi:ABC-type bacteriocin/lantibiotic exporter with double-glycine peptidase domain